MAKVLSHLLVDPGPLHLACFHFLFQSKLLSCFWHKIQEGSGKHPSGKNLVVFWRNYTFSTILGGSIPSWHLRVRQVFLEKRKTASHYFRKLGLNCIHGKSHLKDNGDSSTVWLKPLCTSKAYLKQYSQNSLCIIQPQGPRFLWNRWQGVMT